MEGHRSPPLSQVTSSCPDYLHADVSDGGDLSLHQQEVTNSQLVTESLVPGTEDSDVASECHFYKYFLFVCLFCFFKYRVRHSVSWFFFGVCYAATQLARQVLVT